MFKLGLATACLLAAVLSGAATGRAATLVVDAGILTGAQNLAVGSGVYDVEFVDGTCVALFSGCDQSSDFAFTTLADAQAAATALLTDVFIDGPAGNFGSFADLTRGCPSEPINCYAFVPYASVAGIAVDAAVAVNFGLGFSDDLASLSVSVTDDFSTNGIFVWARFTPVAEVPEPASALLLVVGISGMAAARWRAQGGRDA